MKFDKRTGYVLFSMCTFFQAARILHSYANPADKIRVLRILEPVSEVVKHLRHQIFLNFIKVAHVVCFFKRTLTSFHKHVYLFSLCKDILFPLITNRSLSYLSVNRISN